MPTDSILHNFIISKPDTIKRLADIIKNTEIHSINEPIINTNEQKINNIKETQLFMERFKKYKNL